MTDAWTLQLRNSARRGRLHDAAFLYPGAGLMVTRTGVIPSTTNADGTCDDLRVLPATPTPGLSLRVLAGQCVITTAGQGPYLATLDQTVTITRTEERRVGKERPSKCISQ
jgi:hypothetical protein